MKTIKRLTKRYLPDILAYATILWVMLTVYYSLVAWAADTPTEREPIELDPVPVVSQDTQKPEQDQPEGSETETISLGTFKLTAYCPGACCCGKWADGYTYTGTKAAAGRTIAVDPDVIPLGSIVLINGHAYVAEDIGGAIDGNRIDVFFDSHQDALDFGVKSATVYILQD